MKSLPFKLVSTIGLLLLAEGIYADVLPGSAQPEQISRALTRNPTPTEVMAPIKTEPEKKPSPLSAQAKKIKFQLNGIILEGNHIYSDATLSVLYRNQIHKVITVAQLFEIVQSITNYYRNHGYIISRAILPPQRVKNGILKIRVIEGFIGDVSVTGCPRGAKSLVMAYGEKIKMCRPLEIKRMEYYLLLANEIPGTKVKSVLAASKKKTGAADLTLVTETSPLTGYLSYDNYGTRYIGPQQITKYVGFNSLATAGDNLSVTFVKTPKGKELTYRDINYSMPVNDEGVRWLFGKTSVETHPQFVLAPLKIDGSNDNFYTSLSFPIIRTRSEALTFQASFNYLDTLVKALDSLLYFDEVRSLDLGLTYSFADHYQGINFIAANLRQGLPILNYTRDTDPIFAQTSRPGGKANYTKISFQATRLNTIHGPLSAFIAIRGQYGFNPLLSSEQFAYGGSQLGRGYDVAELLGDRAIAGSIELRYDINIERSFIRTLQPYIFYDGGVVWNIISPVGTPSRLSATSTGAGTRFNFSKYVSGNFMVTQPLSKRVAAEELIGKGRRTRVFFSVVASFG